MMKIEIVYMRVTAMMMVIFYHCACFYTHQWSLGEMYVPEWQFIASFLNYIDMPAFVFISGYLYGYMKFERGKYTDNKVFLKEKAKRLMLPYIVWTAINICLIPSTFSITKILKGYSHLWFLMMLMMVFIIVTATQRLWTRFQQKYFVYFIGFLAVISVIPDLLKVDIRWLCIQQAFKFLPYFFWGILTVKHKSAVCENNKICLIFALLIIAGISWSNASEWNFKGWYYIYSMLVYGSVTILLMTTFSSISELPPRKTCMLMSLDKCSMGIYIIHHIIIIYLLQFREVKNLMVCHYIAMPFILFFVLLFTSWGIVALIQKTPLKIC